MQNATSGARQRLMRERFFLPLRPSNFSAPSSRAFDRSSLALFIALCVAAIAARAWLQFGTPLAPGMNGAYYFVQARALLEHGRLGIPDLPLTFWLQAGLARVIAAVTGWTQDDAIVFAVKLADSVLPPLAALPIAWLGARWQRHDGRPSFLAALVPAAIVCASAAPLSMVGDFQKNSLALVWLAGTAWAAHRFLDRPNLARAAVVVVGLALLGLTHIGVLGAALVFLAVLGAVATFSAPTAVRRRVIVVALTGSAALGGAAAVTYRYDSGRVQRLWRAVAEPSSVVSDSHGPAGRPGFGPPPAPPDGVDDASARAHRAPPPGFGPPGGPGRPGGWMRTVPRVLFIGVGLGALTGVLLCWRRLPVSDRALAAAAGISAAALGGGFFEEQKSERLMLIAIVPAAIAASFLLTRIQRAFPRVVLGLIVGFVATLTGALYVARGARPILTVEQRDELRALAPLIAQPEQTLVVAHHGLEWWTAWTLHTHIAQPTAVSREDWQRYAHIYYLTEKSGAPRDRGRAPGFGPPGMGPEGTTPEGAVTVHDGPLYTLARVDTAPEEQPTDAEVQAQRLKRQ